MGPHIHLPVRDPRQQTRVGAYLERDGQLVQVLEVDLSGVLAEDVRTRIYPDEPRPGDTPIDMVLVEIDPDDLTRKWHPIVPEAA